MLPELRKVVTFDEDIYNEGGRASNPPLRMIGVAAVVKNPWYGQGFVEDLSTEIKRMAPSSRDTDNRQANCFSRFWRRPRGISKSLHSG